jgi:hypothetical protein
VTDDDDDDRKSEEKKREEDETASQAPQILEANFSSSSTAKTASGLDSLFQKNSFLKQISPGPASASDNL